jgi:hypothetical protein
LAYFKQGFKQKKLSNNGVDILILILILQNIELQHAVDYSEKSGSGIADCELVAVHHRKNSGSGIGD